MKRIIDDTGFNKLIKNADGYVLYNVNDTYVGKSLDLYGEYCSREAALLDIFVNPGDVVVEAGANIGSHTIKLAKKIGATGKIYAFEPQRVLFQTLCANMALNSITHAYCYNMAVGEQNGAILVPNLDYTKQENFGGIGQREFGSGDKIPLVRLDDFLGLKSLRLLKIDVEGMEAQVLRGAQNIIKQLRPFIYLENDRQENSPELISLIMGLGYRLFWHQAPLYHSKNFAQNSHNVFEGMISLNMLCTPKEMDVKIQGLEEITDPSQFPRIKYSHPS